MIDTIAFMAGALDLTESQEKALANLLRSVRKTQPRRSESPNGAMPQPDATTATGREID